jgi:DNA-binding transcriptional LysR family regulator
LSEMRDKPAGKVRITTNEHAARTLLWPAIVKLVKRYPDVHVELSIDSGLRDIVTERFDAGVRLGEEVAKDMIAMPISPEMRMARLTFNDIGMVLNAVLEGLGLACVMEDMASVAIDKGKLVRVLADWCPPVSGLSPLLSEPPPADRGLHAAAQGITQCGVRRSPSSESASRTEAAGCGGRGRIDEASTSI